jgi:hypothetical protein
MLLVIISGIGSLLGFLALAAIGLCLDAASRKHSPDNGTEE